MLIVTIAAVGMLAVVSASPATTMVTNEGDEDSGYRFSTFAAGLNWGISLH